MTTNIFTLLHYNVFHIYSKYSLNQIRNISGKTVLASRNKKISQKIPIDKKTYNSIDRQKELSQNEESVYSYLLKANERLRLDRLMATSRVDFINKMNKSTKNYFKPPIIYEGPRNIIFWRRMKRPGKRS